MIKDAEKYKVEDKVHRDRIGAKNRLEARVFKIKQMVRDIFRIFKLLNFSWAVKSQETKRKISLTNAMRLFVGWILIRLPKKTSSNGNLTRWRMFGLQLSKRTDLPYFDYNTFMIIKSVYIYLAKNG